MKNPASISIGLATSSLALGYALSSRWIWAIVIVGLGLCWLAGQQRAGSWLTGLGLIACVTAAAFGVWWGLSTGWMLFSTVAALAAWDLDHFARRIQPAAQMEGETRLKRAHFQRLSIVVGLGLLLGSVALSLQVELNLAGAILLGLLVIIGFSRVIGFLKDRGN